MTLSTNIWARYIERLGAINETAAKKFTAYLNQHDISSAEGRKAAIDYAAALAEKYGESAAAAACEMYDAVAQASGKLLPAAEPAAVASYSDVAKAVNGMAKQKQTNEAMGNAVGRLVKRTGVDTTMQNAIRDGSRGAQWAWVPHGDTCAFCIMLASNGWQRASKKALKNGHAEHIHANCDCTYAVRFDGKSTVAGYDPDKYREMYENAEGDTWQEKMNSMRREMEARRRETVRGKRNPEALMRQYVNRSDSLYRNLQNVPEISGYEDFSIHGVPGAALVEHETTNGRWEQYTASEFGDMIRNDPAYHGGNVRLLSCGTGAKTSNFAQELADKLGVEVLAPTETLWVSENGELFISDSDILAQLWYNDGEIDHGIRQTGKWEKFSPEK